jgi:hypothetical protein
MLDLLLAAWLETATISEMPGEPPLVLVVGQEIPDRAGWPVLARTAACRAFKGDVLTYLLVEVENGYGMPIPAAFHREVVDCATVAAADYF